MKVRALCRIRSGHVVHRAGTVIDLPDAEASRLLAKGRVELEKPDTRPQGPRPEPPKKS